MSNASFSLYKVNVVIFNWGVWEVVYKRLLIGMPPNLGQCVKFIFANIESFCDAFKILSDR